MRNKAKLEGELWDERLSGSSGQNSHLVSKATRLWESILARKGRHTKVPWPEYAVQMRTKWITYLKMSFDLIDTPGQYYYTVACVIYSVKFSTLGYSGGLLKQNVSYSGVLALPCIRYCKSSVLYFLYLKSVGYLFHFDNILINNYSINMSLMCCRTIIMIIL